MSAVASYVRQRDGERCVGESRVTLRGIIASWQQGNAPERIQEAFPSLPLVGIYGAITYYLEHRDELDTSFRETETMLAAR